MHLYNRLMEISLEVITYINENKAIDKTIILNHFSNKLNSKEDKTLLETALESNEEIIEILNKK